MPVDRQPTVSDPEDVAFLEELQALQGDAMPADQDGALEPDEFESRRLPSVTEVDHGAPPIDDTDEPPTRADLEGLALDGLREGETDDAIAATEEGLTYVPPSDPPIDPAADPDSLDELDLTTRIRNALRADAATQPYADQLVVATIGGRAVIRGIVDGIEDTDTIADVVSNVPGITDVVDETTISGG
jgi:hypothetical protein